VQNRQDARTGVYFHGKERIARPPMNHDVEQHGFAVVPRVVEAGEQRELLATLGPVSRAGRRGLLALPAVAELARSARLLALVRPHPEELDWHEAAQSNSTNACRVQAAAKSLER
jgi:hypothetical protein